MFFTLPPKFAYAIFAIMAYAIFVTVHSRLPKCKRQLNVMFICGGIGGILISQLYRRDFWNPPSILGFTQGPVYVTIEDLLFGGSFIGLVTLLPQLLAGRHLESREVTESVVNRLMVVGVTVLTSAAFLFGGLNSLTATSLGFLAGACVLCLLHRDLAPYVFLGAAITPVLYLSFLIMFFVLAENWIVLADSFCQYCRQVNALDVVLLRLTFWSAAFGALFGPFYAFMASKRYVKTWPRGHYE